MLDPFTNSRFLPEHKLLTWYPKGILDLELATATVDWVGFQEKVSDEPFNRFADWSNVSEVHLDLAQLHELAGKRREAYGNGPSVKSAFFGSSFAATIIALMFSKLMEASPIEARVFLKVGEAAEWLGVPASALAPERRA